jgi:hypothetical protein
MRDHLREDLVDRKAFLRQSNSGRKHLASWQLPETLMRFQKTSYVPGDANDAQVTSRGAIGGCDAPERLGTSSRIEVDVFSALLVLQPD